MTPETDYAWAAGTIDGEGCISMYHPKVDMVNHPPHYKRGGIESIDVIEAFELGFNLGNVVKYVLRSDSKGRTLEDLQKARWYLNREINNLEKREGRIGDVDVSGNSASDSGSLDRIQVQDGLSSGSGGITSRVDSSTY